MSSIEFRNADANDVFPGDRETSLCMLLLSMDTRRPPKDLWRPSPTSRHGTTRLSHALRVPKPTQIVGWLVTKWFAGRISVARGFEGRALLCGGHAPRLWSSRERARRLGESATAPARARHAIGNAVLNRGVNPGIMSVLLAGGDAAGSRESE